MVYPNAEASSENPTRSLSGGAIAGIVLGLLAALAALAVAAFLLWRRRKQNRPPFNNHGAPEMTSGIAGTSPRRNVSVLSKAGLLSRGNQPEHYNEPDEPFHLQNTSARHSLFYTQEGVNPESPLDSNRRYSRPMVYDQRLNPSALWANAEANGSRVSMQDNADYSRPLDGGLGGRTLGVVNPDPRASFDSRG